MLMNRSGKIGIVSRNVLVVVAREVVIRFRYRGISRVYLAGCEFSDFIRMAYLFERDSLLS